MCVRIRNGANLRNCAALLIFLGSYIRLLRARVACLTWLTIWGLLGDGPIDNMCAREVNIGKPG